MISYLFFWWLFGCFIFFFTWMGVETLHYLKYHREKPPFTVMHAISCLGFAFIWPVVALFGLVFWIMVIDHVMRERGIFDIPLFDPWKRIRSKHIGTPR